MKNTDLRIGNWVSVYGKFKKVESIGTYGLSFDTGFAKYTLPNLKPILLTEEILLKCGFKYNKHGGIFAITEFPSVICIYKDGDTKWNDRYIDCKILYLHQLQNLYHALTGQELKIEL